MVSKEEFEAAAKEAGDKDGPLAKISNEQKLNLYALYKQVGQAHETSSLFMEGVGDAPHLLPIFFAWNRESFICMESGREMPAAARSRGRCGTR
jgi:hypothetical protein